VSTESQATLQQTDNETDEATRPARAPAGRVGAKAGEPASATAGIPVAPDGPIMLHRMGDLGEMYARAGSGQLHPMRGFDADYTNIVDYIVRITHRIWEEKDIGLIYDTYSHNVSVWRTDGLTKGREAVVASTVQAIAGSPAPRIFVDEVIWTGNEDDGFHTSMRYTSTNRNLGYSAYGPPTGHTVRSRGVANCFVKENRIVEEWTVGEMLGVVRQLGHDPYELAVRAARTAATHGDTPADNERYIGQFVPPPYERTSATTNGIDVPNFLGEMMHEVWNRRRLNRIDRYYAPHCLVHASTGKELYGRGDLKLHVLGLLGAFPDAAVSLDHLYWMQDEHGDIRTALRWTFAGTYNGTGIYGPPTGRPGRLMVISQHHIHAGQIVEEWMIYDEFALMKQIVAP